MSDPRMPREVVIKGVTASGSAFRPGDWDERLCGVLAAYRPGYGTALVTQRGPVFGYSPYVRPALIAGIRCVVVDSRLRDLEPRAWDFVIGFAKDNQLVTLDAAELVAAPTLPEIPPAAG